MLKTGLVDYDWTIFGEFQSLIGMLKTVTVKSGGHYEFLFQSLIGMLKTLIGPLFDYPAKLFQSLIGMLKTKSCSFLLVFWLTCFNPS